MQLSTRNLDLLRRLLNSKALQLEEDWIDTDECYAFWDSRDVVQWFAEKGYTLYRRVLEPECYEQFTVPTLPFESFCESNYPYAYHNAYPVDGGSSPKLTATDVTGRIVFAQDSHYRHVVIKATHKETEEYRVLSFLYSQSLEVLRQNCILPVLDMLHFGDACFVVMPRWGRRINEPTKFQTMKDVLKIMQSTLKSLNFLHSHYVIHRDIRFANILVNHFGAEPMFVRPEDYRYWDTRLEQLSQGKLEYAVIDFDLARILPANMTREEYTLPAQESYVGSHHPEDTSQGEFEYNPFAYDVGTLGVLLRSPYQHLTQDIPLLAPFLDRLTTRDVRKRFTAAEALCFVGKIISDSTEAQLSTIACPPPELQTPDIWQGLPLEFQKEWAAYREPIGLPFSTRILRVFVFSTWVPGFRIVRNVRWFFWRLTSGPRRAWSQFLGLMRLFRL